MENINKIQIVPDEVYEIGADKAPVIPEWSVKDDETLWQKVNKLAHSTFDRSKFTVVGSPNITNDGIASGFSSSNKISFSISQNSFNTIDFYFKNPNGTKMVLCSETAKVFIRKSWPTQYRITARKASGDIVYDQVFNIPETAVNIHVKIEQNKMSLYADGVESTSGSYSADFSQMVLQQTWFVGSNQEGNEGFTGSIDLKQLSIIVDGVPVFSGNKTGIDTIKPDDYTVVGSPTISADGVASGFSDSSNNYLRTSLVRSDITDCEIYCRVVPYFDDAITTGQYVFKRNYSDNTSGLIGCYGNQRLFVTFQGDHYGDFFFTSGVTTDIILKLKDGVLSNYISTDDGATWTKNFEVENITSTMSFNDLCLGVGFYLWAGSIDLNAFKIYVDGDLVYQPCLKIPYTEGQNYVKVVDKLYRDRVKDLFEQEGYNIYYTLGDDDFTLPSNKPNDIVKYKADGLTVAEQRADQTLTIRGACEQGVDVNLPMDFFDGSSYAVFGVGTTGTNTASKFTPAADGNYIAIGKGKV